MDKLYSVFVLRIYIGQNIYFVALRVIDKYGFLQTVLYNFWRFKFLTQFIFFNHFAQVFNLNP